MNAPPKILTIDTSHGRGTVAAIEGDRIAARELPVAGAHARTLAALVADAAAALGWPPAAADIVAVVRGPGSFTGLRVGVTSAKALAWASGARLVGISAIAALAEAAARVLGRRDRPVMVAFDAGRRELFVARAVPAPRAADGWEWEPGQLVAADTWLATMPAGTLMTGPGLRLLPHGADLAPAIACAPPEAWDVSPADIATLATRRLAAGLTDDPATLVPDYMRPSYAEEKPAARQD